MPFQKGQPRPQNAGRRKGSPNKRDTIFESLEKIQTVEGDPVDVVKLFFADMMKLPEMQRAEMWLRFMEFIYPKQRNLEVNADVGIQVNIKDYTKKDA